MHDHLTATSEPAVDPALLLGFGQFFGHALLGAEAHGIVVREAAARPTYRHVPRHTHEHAHFCLVLSGTFETTAHNFQGRCGSATLVFHPAGTTHADQFLSRRGRFMIISLASEFLQKVDVPRLSERSIVLDDVEIGFPGARMRRELRTADSFSAVSLEGLTLELVGRVLARTEHADTRQPEWLARSVAFLRDRATDSVRVAAVAEAAGVHPVHLARVFRRHLGLSPGEYLRRARVRAAMSLVEQTREPLAAVAVSSGFGDQSELTKAFRRELGVTPALYRRAVRR